MEIITENSEQALVDVLRHVRNKPGEWMSLHINIAPLHSQRLEKEGLSQNLLANIRSASIQIAQKLLDAELSTLTGQIMVFEDSDILALFTKPKESFLNGLLGKIRSEFAKNAMSHLLTIEEVGGKFAQIVVMAQEKQNSAEDYRIKKRAVELAENLSKNLETDPKLSEEVQKKRRSRASSCVLIIEDDVMVRGLLATMLGDEHQVVQARNTESGIIAYIDRAPNIVFLDINMPGRSGRDALKHLMRIDPEAYVVMLSGQSSSENVIATKTAGAAGFITKPFSRDKLSEYIKKCPSIGSEATAKALGWFVIKNP